MNNVGMIVVDFITAVVFNVENRQRQCTNKNTIFLTRWLFFLSFLFLSTAVCAQSQLAGVTVHMQ